MIKEIKHKENGFTQQCQCGALKLIKFSDLTKSEESPRVLRLPQCSKCSSLEFLILNGGRGDHDLKVAQVFAELSIR